MSVRVRVKVDDLGGHEKETGHRRQGPQAKFQNRQERNRAAIYSCTVCTLHKAPREGMSEAETEPTVHSQNCVPGKGLYLPGGRTFTDRGQRGMAR